MEGEVARIFREVSQGEVKNYREKIKEEREEEFPSLKNFCRFFVCVFPKKSGYLQEWVTTRRCCSNTSTWLHVTMQLGGVCCATPHLVSPTASPNFPMVGPGDKSSTSPSSSLPIFSPTRENIIFSSIFLSFYFFILPLFTPTKHNFKVKTTSRIL